MHGCRGAGEAVCLRLHIQRCVDAGGQLTEGTCGATVLPLVLALPSCANTASPIPVKPPACSTDPSCALQRARGGQEVGRLCSHGPLVGFPPVSTHPWKWSCGLSFFLGISCPCSANVCLLCCTLANHSRGGSCQDKQRNP